MNIVVYTKSGCPYCDMAKSWLDQNGFEYQTVVLDDQQERQDFYKICGDQVNTVPQIFVNDQRLGGYYELITQQDQLLANKMNFDEDF